MAKYNSESNHEHGLQSLRKPEDYVPKPGPLSNSREENFVQYLAIGDSQRTAYHKAFPASEKWKDRTVDNRACELANRRDILGRLNELKQEKANKAVMQRQERMEVLTSIARDKSEIAKARMQAIDILNKMSGEYVKKIEASVSTDTSDIASKVRHILNEVSAGDSA